MEDNIDFKNIDFKSNNTPSPFPYLKKGSGKHATSEYSKFARLQYNKIKGLKSEINGLNGELYCAAKIIDEIAHMLREKNTP